MGFVRLNFGNYSEGNSFLAHAFQLNATKQVGDPSAYFVRC